MKAITITKHGGPEVLELREYPDPEPDAGEVVVDVKAAGFNFAELMARQGLYDAAPDPPCVMGFEAAGVVLDTGEGVTSVKPGDRVIATAPNGAHATRLCTEERFVVGMPDDMEFEEGAAIPVNFVTAHHMLFHVAGLRKGNRVLIHMAAGGVGTAAIQLCRTVKDVEIFGTSSPGKHELIEELGCDHPIDYRSRDYAEVVGEITDGEGVDIVLDALGGRDWQKGYDLLRPAGHLVAFGFANAVSGSSRNWFHLLREWWQIPTFNPLHMIDDNKSVSGVHIGRLWNRSTLLASSMEELMTLYENEQIRPVIDSTFSFEEAAGAHRRMQNRENTGKIVFVP